jgi:hypothetical protein
MAPTPPQEPTNPLTEALRGLFGPLLNLLKDWPPLLAFGGVTMLLVVVVALLGAVVPDNLVLLLYLAFVLTEAAFVWSLWDERRRASAPPQERLENEMQKDKAETSPGSQTSIGQSEGPVLSGTFHGPVTVGAQPTPSAPAPTTTPPDADQSELVRLHQVLSTRFDQEELRTLCFKLGVAYDDLRGEGRDAKARELVGYMDRRGELDRLRAVVEAERP